MRAIKHIDHTAPVRTCLKSLEETKSRYLAERKKISRLTGIATGVTRAGAPATDANAFETQRRQAQKELDRLGPEFQGIKDTLNEQERIVREARKAASKTLIDDSRSQIRKLLKRQLDAQLVPLVDTLTARADMQRLKDTLEAAGLEPQFSRMIPQPRWDGIDDHADRLRDDVETLLQGDWITLSDLPKELIALWRLGDNE